MQIKLTHLRLDSSWGIRAGRCSTRTSRHRNRIFIAALILCAFFVVVLVLIILILFRVVVPSAQLLCILRLDVLDCDVLPALEHSIATHEHVLNGKLGTVGRLQICRRRREVVLAKGLKQRVDDGENGDDDDDGDEYDADGHGDDDRDDDDCDDGDGDAYYDHDVGDGGGEWKTYLNIDMAQEQVAHNSASIARPAHYGL